MLTNLVEGGGFTCIKCNMYWPESVGDTKRFGDIEVQLFDKAEVNIDNIRDIRLVSQWGGSANKGGGGHRKIKFGFFFLHRL